jgi:hypothetical protein
MRPDHRTNVRIAQSFEYSDYLPWSIGTKHKFRDNRPAFNLKTEAKLGLNSVPPTS